MRAIPTTRCLGPRIRSDTSSTMHSESVSGMCFLLGDWPSNCYYNMDQVVARALMVFEKIISRTRVAKPDNDYANTVIAR